MRRFYYLNGGPMNFEVLLRALTGEGGQELELQVECWKRDENENKFQDEFSGKIALRVEVYGRLRIKDLRNTLTENCGTVMRIQAVVVRLERYGDLADQAEPAMFKLEGEADELACDMVVELWYDYAAGQGVLYKATGYEYEAEADRWRVRELMPVRCLCDIVQEDYGNAVNSLVEYQTCMKNLGLPDELCLNEDLLEVLRASCS